MKRTNTLIIGASAAGLACAAHLSKEKIPYVILEKQAHVAHAWRNHYDRLHLHTNKSASNLPFVKFEKSVPKYATRDQVVKYLEDYQTTLKIKPEFKVEVNRVERKGESWIVKTSKNDYESKNVIVCIGNTNIPKLVSKPGLNNFDGKIMHSAEYKNGAEFRDKKVLVIGFGNSACEIAICLHEHGAYPSISVRSKVNVIPRDVFGIPSLQIGILESKLSPRVADIINKPIVDLLIGNIEKCGLKKLSYGPIEQIATKHKIPLLDIGTMKLIRNGKIKIYGDIEKIDGKSIQFEDGKMEDFDTIIMGTGYKTGLEKIMELCDERKEDIQMDIKKRKCFGHDNIYFCGFYVSPAGMLREIKIESGYIAKAIGREFKQSQSTS